MSRSLGQIGYEAYADVTEGKSIVTGDELPEWARLPYDIRNAWELAAATIAANVGKQQNGDDDGDDDDPDRDDDVQV